MTGTMRIAALLAAVWLVGVGISSAQGRLIDAVRANDVGAVRTLLDARADVNAVQPDGRRTIGAVRPR